MSNIIQIKRGQTEPGYGILAPYELGYVSPIDNEGRLNDDSDAGFLFIGIPTTKINEKDEEIDTTKSQGIKVEEARTITDILPVDKGGTGFNFLENTLNVPQDALIVFNRTKGCFGYINNNPGTIYYDKNKSFVKGVLPLEFGGTGATTAEEAITNLKLGAVATENVVPVTKGGTGLTTLAEGCALISNDGSNISLQKIQDITTVGHCDYDATKAKNLVNLNTLAYWNGRYKDGYSNLAYCTKGAFGTIVTKNAGDYLPLSGGGTLKGTLYINNSTDADATKDNNVGLIIGNRAANHIIMDDNEIIAKSNATTEGILWLGAFGLGAGSYGSELPKTNLSTGRVFFKKV